MSQLELIHVHADRLLLYARSWCRRHGEAEDMLQEAYLRFMRGPGHEAREPLAYLYACVRSAALDFAKSETRRRVRENRSAMEVDQEARFACSLQGEERRLIIERALEDLTPEQHEVVVLRIWCERSFGEIAELLGIGSEAARSRYRAGLERLRSIISVEDL